MPTLQSTEDWKSLQSKKSVVLTGLLVVLVAVGLWYHTEGFSNGQVGTLTSAELGAGVVTGGILGLIDLFTQVNDQIQQFQNRNLGGISLGLVIAALFGVIGAILVDATNISLTILLVSFISFLVVQFIFRTYSAFID